MTKRPLTRAVHVIGDSHASVFGGHHGLLPLWPGQVAPGSPGSAALPGVKPVHLGPFLAHSVATPRHKVRRLIRAALRDAERSEPVLLAFGEIDLRCHVVPHAATSRRTINRVASDLALAYAQAGREIVGVRPLGFWAPPPPVRRAVANEDYPVRGTFTQRLRAARAFIRSLHTAARAVDARVLDVTAEVSARDGGPLEAFFADEVHLGPRSLPLIAAQLIGAGWTGDAAALRAAARALSLAPLPVSSPPVPPSPALSMPPGCTTPEEAQRALIDRAALECLSMGARRIALFGAGRHTRRIGLAPWRKRGLNVVAILDDRAATPGALPRTMLGVPVRSPQAAADSVQAVVISSDAAEDQLTTRAQQVLGPRGVPIVRIYRWAEATRSRTNAKRRSTKPR